jgi:hypothetical protein
MAITSRALIAFKVVACPGSQMGACPPASYFFFLGAAFFGALGLAFFAMTEFSSIRHPRVNALVAKPALATLASLWSNHCAKKSDKVISAYST